MKQGIYLLQINMLHLKLSIHKTPNAPDLSKEKKEEVRACLALTHIGEEAFGKLISLAEGWYIWLH